MWVTNHYDGIHLRGIIRYNREICEFRTNINNRNTVSIYWLSTIEKIKWIMRKKTFEWCVGYHFSYPKKKNWVYFHLKKPYWLHKMCFNFYYYVKGWN